MIEGRFKRNYLCFRMHLEGELILKISVHLFYVLGCYFNILSKMQNHTAVFVTHFVQWMRRLSLFGVQCHRITEHQNLGETWEANKQRESLPFHTLLNREVDVVGTVSCPAPAPFFRLQQEEVECTLVPALARLLGTSTVLCSVKAQP